MSNNDIRNGEPISRREMLKRLATYVGLGVAGLTAGGVMAEAGVSINEFDKNNNISNWPKKIQEYLTQDTVPWRVIHRRPGGVISVTKLTVNLYPDKPNEIQVYMTNFDAHGEMLPMSPEPFIIQVNSTEEMISSLKKYLDGSVAIYAPLSRRQ